MSITHSLLVLCMIVSTRGLRSGRVLLRAASIRSLSHSSHTYRHIQRDSHRDIKRDRETYKMAMTSAARTHRDITLLPEEEDLFDTLLQVISDERLGTTVRVAGGWVRDRMLGKTDMHDIDLALDNMSGSKFAEALVAWNKKKGNKKSKHLETATMRLGKFEVDFVQLRSEQYTSSSRIPEITFGTPLEDALRRDLTINSLFFNINTREVEDFTGRGLEDLQQGIVCTPLPALVTLQDDPLRALRAVRFASRYNFAVATDLQAACRDPTVHCALTTKVSRERISKEVSEMLAHPSAPVRAIPLLYRLQLLPLVIACPTPQALYDTSGVALTDAGCSVDPSNIGSEPLARLGLNLVLASHLVQLHARRRGEPVLGGDVENKLFRYAALTCGAHGVTYLSAPPGTNKRPRPVPLEKHMCLHELHTGNKDADSVSTIQRGAEALLSLLRLLSAALASEGSDERLWQVVELDGCPTWGPIGRVRLGMVLRDVGEFFAPALLLACARLVLEAEAEGDTTAELIDLVIGWSDGDHNPSIEREGTGGEGKWEKRIDSSLRLARALEAGVFALQLEEEWRRPVPLSGKDIKQFLTKIPAGPTFTEILNSQTDYHLRHPNCTPTDIANYLKEKYASFV